MTDFDVKSSAEHTRGSVSSPTFFPGSVSACPSAFGLQSDMDVGGKSSCESTQFELPSGAGSGCPSPVMLRGLDLMKSMSSASGAFNLKLGTPLRWADEAAMSALSASAEMTHAWCKYCPSILRRGLSDITGSPQTGQSPRFSAEPPDGSGTGAASSLTGVDTET